MQYLCIRGSQHICSAFTNTVLLIHNNTLKRICYNFRNKQVNATYNISLESPDKYLSACRVYKTSVSAVFGAYAVLLQTRFLGTLWRMPYNFTYTQDNDTCNISLESLYKHLSTHRVCSTYVSAVFSTYAVLLQTRFDSFIIIPLKEYAITLDISK
jgi:hypothetical protein